ncbi:hypothetical protein [Streptosporangium sandarakinum]|uniref:hypothetical protein n=1 Tax=Streptosporangium sandarakinum TaxID=1260955 RepID=UPI0037226F40
MAAIEPERIRTSRQLAEPLGRVIGEPSEHDALTLEVHQAFTAPQTTADPVPVLPPYLPREGFDDRLRAAVAAAGPVGGFVAAEIADEIFDDEEGGEE